MELVLAFDYGFVYLSLRELKSVTLFTLRKSYARLLDVTICISGSLVRDSLSGCIFLCQIIPLGTLLRDHSIQLWP